MKTYKMTEEQRAQLERMAAMANTAYLKEFLDSLAVENEPEGATAKFKVGDKVGVKNQGAHGVGVIESVKFTVNFGYSQRSEHAEEELETLAERAARLRAEADACEKEAGK